jgi:hypothetical protein
MGSPAGLAPDPFIVDQGLMELDRVEPRGACSTHVVAQEMDVRLDRDRVPVGVVEVGRHPGRHDEERVVPDEHERSRFVQETPRFAVQRRELWKMLVDKRAHHEVVVATRKARRSDVGLDEALVQTLAARHVQHLRRHVDAVDRAHALRVQPRTGSTSPASQVRGSTDGGPRDGVDPLEERKVHRVLDRALVGRDPVAVALSRRDGAVVTSIEPCEVRHGSTR